MKPGVSSTDAVPNITALLCLIWWPLTPQAGTVEKLHDFEQALEDQQAQLKPPRGEEQDGHQA